LVVLRSPKTPSILLELGFLSNPKEADLLSNDTYLETLASDVSLALSSYIYQKNAIIAAGLVN
jgi:N-acetylmuramoyl-L-alanine amidase